MTRSFLFTNMAYTTPILIFLSNLFYGGLTFLPAPNTKTSQPHLIPKVEHSNVEKRNNGNCNSHSDRSLKHHVTVNGPQCDDFINWDMSWTNGFTFFDQLRIAGPSSVIAPPRVWTILRSQFLAEVALVCMTKQVKTGNSESLNNGRFIHSDRYLQVRNVMKQRYNKNTATLICNHYSS